MINSDTEESSQRRSSLISDDQKAKMGEMKDKVKDKLNS